MGLVGAHPLVYLITLSTPSFKISQVQLRQPGGDPLQLLQEAPRQDVRIATARDQNQGMALQQTTVQQMLEDRVFLNHQNPLGLTRLRRNMANHGKYHDGKHDICGNICAII